MKNTDADGKGKVLVLTGFCAVAAAAIVTVVVLSAKGLQQNLYEERVFSLSQVVEKIYENVNTIIGTKWENADYFGRKIFNYDFSTKAELLETVSAMENILSHEDSTYFLIDSEGLCCLSDGTEFQWGGGSSPSEITPSTVYVMRFPCIESGAPQLIFPSRLEFDIQIPGHTVQYVALAFGMSNLDPVLDIRELGMDDTAFILQSDGTPVYKPRKANVFSGFENAVDILRQSEILYAESKDDIREDIRNNRSACSVIQWQGEVYFLSYHKLNINDWNIIIVVPEYLVGSNSVRFMRTVILYISMIAVFVMIVLSLMLGWSSSQVLRRERAANETFRQAAQAAQSANEAKTRFLSSMSHDIRTPMNGIVGMTTIAQKHLDDPERVQECLKKIELASDHLLTLLNDVLDISKIEGGKMALHPIVFSLEKTVSDFTDIMRTQVQEKALQFDIHVYNILYEYLYADELRLKQIFINILTNAIKYTQAGGRIVLDLKEEKIPDNPKAVRILYSVQDSGIGMTQEFMDMMYDTFSRAMDSRIDKIQGSGLGLAIVKNLVDLMGGHIDCQSEVNKGTRFTITVDLPIAEHQAGGLSLPPICVLVVDDDEVFLESARDTLQTMGASVDTATDGESAVEMVVKRHAAGDDYPVMILDWKLPGMDGPETARVVREKVGGEMPIIIISSYDWTDIEDSARAVGVNGFINKPIFPSVVYAKLNEFLHFDDSKPALAETAKSDDLNGLHLLIAEDNDLNWEIIAEILSMNGISADRAKDGRICVDMISAAKQGDYDLILMDVQMPIMNGREATQKIRHSTDPAVSKIPIIAMTADAFSEDIAACMKAGMNGHVSKPVDTQKLFSEMRRVLGMGGGYPLT